MESTSGGGGLFIVTGLGGLPNPLRRWGRRRVRQGYLVGSCHAEEQACEVLERYRLYGKIRPLSRCPLCSGMLEVVAKERVRHLLLPKTARHYEHFQRCVGCHRLYWQGSHYEKIRRWVESLKLRSD